MQQSWESPHTHLHRDGVSLLKLCKLADRLITFLGQTINALPLLTIELLLSES